MKVVYRDNRMNDGSFDNTIDNLERIYYSRDDRQGEGEASALSSFVGSKATRDWM